MKGGAEGGITAQHRLQFLIKLEGSLISSVAKLILTIMAEGENDQGSELVYVYVLSELLV